MFCKQWLCTYCTYTVMVQKNITVPKVHRSSIYSPLSESLLHLRFLALKNNYLLKLGIYFTCTLYHSIFYYPSVAVTS